jgi:hypothetical protein
MISLFNEIVVIMATECHFAEVDCICWLGYDMT